MLEVIYVLMSWLLMTLIVWAGLPLENRSLGAVVSIEIVAVLIWVCTVCFLA